MLETLICRKCVAKSHSRTLTPLTKHLLGLIVS